MKGLYVKTNVINKDQIKEMQGKAKFERLSKIIGNNYDCVIVEQEPGVLSAKADIKEYTRTPNELYQVGDIVLKDGGRKLSSTRPDNPDDEYIEKLAVALLGFVDESVDGAEMFVSLMEGDNENNYTS